MRRDENDLDKMARGNEKRELVVKGRRERRKSLTRYVKCLICLETTYSLRDKIDPCPECIQGLWSAQDVSLAASAASVGDGMVAVKFSKREHDFPYPHMQVGRKTVPPTAAFAQRSHHQTGEFEDSVARTFQRIVHKALAGLAEAYPLPPDFSRGMVPLFGTMYDNDHRALLPQKTVGALMELWPYVTWLSAVSYEAGLEEGRNLLGQINAGTLTVNDFNEQIAKQTRSIHHARDKAENGKIDRE